MKALVLGLGFQGKAVIHDLETGDMFDSVLAADLDTTAAGAYVAQAGLRKTTVRPLDAKKPDALAAMIRDAGASVVICMLPPQFTYPVAKAALDAALPFVSTSYTDAAADLDAEARAKGVAILPEMGMDPGIDLVLCRKAISELDTVYGLYSYGAGVPEPACRDTNPIRYKLTWTFEGVLNAYMRPARYLEGGQEKSIPAGRIFREANTHLLEVPGVGPMEGYYNGDAVSYIRRFDLGDSVRDMGRFALRWPGHCDFWSKLSDLGFLDDTPLTVAGARITPRDFMVSHLGPRLRFAENERDLVIVMVQARGLKDGKPRTVTLRLLDYRDLDTGLFAMNRTVGYTAAIGARMLLDGTISAKGVLNPARDVPPDALLAALARRGMNVTRDISE